MQARIKKTNISLTARKMNATKTTTTLCCTQIFFVTSASVGSIVTVAPPKMIRIAALTLSMVLAVVTWTIAMASTREGIVMDTVILKWRESSTNIPVTLAKNITIAILITQCRVCPRAVFTSVGTTSTVSVLSSASLVSMNVTHVL